MEEAQQDGGIDAGDGELIRSVIEFNDIGITGTVLMIIFNHKNRPRDSRVGVKMP